MFSPCRPVVIMNPYVYVWVTSVRRIYLQYCVRYRDKDKKNPVQCVLPEEYSHKMYYIQTCNTFHFLSAYPSLHYYPIAPFLLSVPQFKEPY